MQWEDKEIILVMKKEEHFARVILQDEDGKIEEMRVPSALIDLLDVLDRNSDKISPEDKYWIQSKLEDLVEVSWVEGNEAQRPT